MCEQCKSRSVVLLDDDPVQMQVAQLMLACGGAHADGFTIPQQALEHVVRLQAPVTVLVDWNMPGTETARLCAEFRALVPSLRLVGLSATRPAAEVLDLFDHFLIKPLDPAQLAAALCACGKCASPSHEDSTHLTADQLLAAALDRKIFQSFALKMPATQLDAMYAAYFADADRRMATMEAAIRANDLATLHTAAHALKGSSAMLGVRLVADAAAQLETASAGDHAALLELRHLVASIRVAMQSRHSAISWPTEPALPATQPSSTALPIATLPTESTNS